ncbi:MAG TPA: 50S ribosomal protein L11 methyltransferase [Solirubrobacteraceae bacterium]|nr:50S ribosomal protein L11 methyltransferase [Solirubrobacteraceae bacterium]
MSWLNNIGILHYHASLVADVDRVDRFRDAIHEVVRPGDVVVDIGTGTGLLAYFACQAGAARVFAIEEGPIIELAREIAMINRLDDRVEFFNDRSYRVQLPEQADVLVSETLWNFGVGEGMIGTLTDARRRFLKPGARVIPEAVDLHVAPVQADGVYAMLHDRPPDRDGLDLSPIRYYQVNNVHMPHLSDENFLAKPALLVSTELDGSAEADFEADVTVLATRSGVMHGTCGWFRSRLSPSVVLENEPPSVKSSWAHAFFPVLNPIAVQTGDEISLHIETADDGTIWRWRTELRRAGTVVASYDQSSSLGFPVARGLPGRDGAAAGPRTTLRGEVVSWVLDGMDGTRSLTQLEADVLQRFGSRFAEPADALEIVRDAVQTLGA